MYVTGVKFLVHSFLSVVFLRFLVSLFEQGGICPQGEHILFGHALGA